MERKVKPKIQPDDALSVKIRGCPKQTLTSLMESTEWFPIQEDALYKVYLDECMRQKLIELENASRFRRIRQRVADKGYGNKV